MRVEIAGENALIIYFGETADTVISTQVQQAAALLETSLAETLIEMVPSYASLLVIYDPLLTDHFAVSKVIRQVLSQLSDTEQQSGQIVTLPVYYSPESGPDLEMLAERAGLSVDEVISIHSEME